MTVMKCLKKHAMLPAVLLSSCLSAEDPLGLIGGQAGTAAYAAYISPSGTVAGAITTGFPTGVISSVAVNPSGQGLIGGQAPINIPYAALVQPSGAVTPITLNPAFGVIDRVAINSQGQGLVGGTITAISFYAVIVSPSGVATTLTTPAINGIIQGVAINDAGQGLIGGTTTVGHVPYLALVVPSLVPAVSEINTGLAQGNIVSVAINASGLGLIGGASGTGLSQAAYAALVSPSGDLAPISLPSAPFPAQLTSVAINNSGQGIVGGTATGGGLAPYVARILPSGEAAAVPLSIAANGNISTVGINAFGQGIIGGTSGTGLSQVAYAAFISPSGVETVIPLGLPSGSVIRGVAINNASQGLIGGQAGVGAPYVAIVSPTGVATRINLGFAPGNIISVAILPLLSQIPTGSLSGNNLDFANYINTYAPQDAFYFVPAVFDGTLAQALESAAPTRNAIALYTASNNLFYLNNRLSGHLRSKVSASEASHIAVGSAQWMPEELVASVSSRLPQKQSKPYTWWLDGIGALSYQQAQKQTVGFNPTTSAALLGFDAMIGSKGWVGGGAAYSYTHIHERKDAGHSRINQEYFFMYGSYQGSCFYLDGALWGGLFQITQVRNIRMTGFEFKSTSTPSGWQLSPHLEMGWNIYKERSVTVDPFVMLDWASAWQKHYREKGSGPFNAAQKKHYSSLLRTELGVRVYETISFDTWRLIFEEKGSYVYKKPFRVGRVNAFLVGFPGTFTVETLTTPQNLGVAEFGMTFEPVNECHPYGTIAYQGEFGASSQSHQVTLELAWNF